MRFAGTLFCGVILFVVVFFMAPGAEWRSMAQDSVILPDPDLPPESDPSDCEDLISLYALEGSPLSFDIIVPSCTMDDIRHRCFTDVNRQTMGIDELETFDSIWDAMMDFGSGPVSASLIGPVQTITYGRTLGTTGTFDTEIVSMTLSGDVDGMPIILRESPTHASLGQTIITDLGGELYQFESFFDVFIELSVDGGESWYSANDSGRLTLVLASTVATLPTSWGAIKSLYK